MDTLEMAQNLYKSQSNSEKKRRAENKKAFFECNGLKRFWVEQNEKFIHRGDEVVLRKSGNILVGPFEVLAFTSDGKKIYLDWDCYQSAEPIENVVVVLTELK